MHARQQYYLIHDANVVAWLCTVTLFVSGIAFAALLLPLCLCSFMQNWPRLIALHLRFRTWGYEPDSGVLNILFEVPDINNGARTHAYGTMQGCIFSMCMNMYIHAHVHVLLIHMVGSG